MSTAHDVPMRVTGLAPRGADSSVRDDGALVYRPPRGRLCSEREPQLQPNVPDAEHRSLAMTAIFFAAAFLEALVNEVIIDVAEPPPGGPSARVAGIPVDAKTRGAFQSLWKNQRRIRGCPLGKYQAALDVVGKRRYNATRLPFKSAQLVFDLRNHFVHFKPETQDIDAEHDFEKALKRAKVVENQQQIGAPWFPRMRRSALG